MVAEVGFASLEPPDKQWVSTVYPKGKFAKANFLLIQIPLNFPSVQINKGNPFGLPLFIWLHGWSTSRAVILKALEIF